MNRRIPFAVTAVALMLSASMMLAQAATTTASGAAAKAAKPVAGAKAVAAATAKPVAAAATKPAAAATVARMVDLNSATKAELMTLPGIGEAISAKIIAGRPWANKAQLLSKNLVSKPVYDKLSGLVIAKQPGGK